MAEGRFDMLFNKASQSTILTSIPTICELILGILIVIFSIIQAFPIIPDGASDDETWSDLCKNELIEYLSPFHFLTNYEGNAVGCQWRQRNTIFRGIMSGLSILTSIVALIVLFSGKFPKAWPVLYWINWLLFVLMFVVFILDCDGINTGYNSCNKGFEVEGDPIIIFIQPGVIEIEQCYIYPFVYTALCDLAASIMAFCAYKISKYYIFDSTERKASIANKTTPKSSNGNNNNNNNNNNKPSTTQLATETQKKGDSPDPFVEYQGSYEVDNGNKRKSTGGTYAGRISAYDE